VRGRVVGTTGEHPFWVEGKGWTAAGELRIGDVLVSHDGQRVPVEGVADSGDVATVYNFRIAGHHTYFVGCEEWGFSAWAHNANYGLARLLEARSRVADYFAHARQLHQTLGLGNAALASAGLCRSIASGFRHRQGLLYINPEDVLRFGMQIDARFPHRRYLDPVLGGVRHVGGFFASHAEKKLALWLHRRGLPMEMASVFNMCENCIEFMGRVAEHAGRTAVVRDPRGTHFFTPQGAHRLWPGS
jgi:hypothetical protein